MPAHRAQGARRKRQGHAAVADGGALPVLAFRQDDQLVAIERNLHLLGAKTLQVGVEHQLAVLLVNIEAWQPGRRLIVHRVRLQLGHGEILLALWKKPYPSRRCPATPAGVGGEDSAGSSRWPPLG